MVYRRPSKEMRNVKQQIAAVGPIKYWLIAKALPPRFVWPIGHLGANALQPVLCDWVRSQVLHILHPKAILIEIFGACVRLTYCFYGSPGRIRTADQRINSP
jgi:hypothetical protein